MGVLDTLGASLDRYVGPKFRGPALLALVTLLILLILAYRIVRNALNQSHRPKPAKRRLTLHRRRGTS